MKALSIAYEHLNTYTYIYTQIFLPVYVCAYKSEITRAKILVTQSD